MDKDKCVICGQNGEGLMCRHCIAKGASNAGKFAKGAGKIVGMLVVAALGAVIKDKINNRDDSES